MAVASLLSVLSAELPDSVVVTAAAPLDSQRLADALRTYLDEFGIHVQVAPATAGGDLRSQLDDARHLGESVRAVAVIRAERETRGEVEVELVRSRHRQGAGGGRAATGARRGSLPGARAEDSGDPARHAFQRRAGSCNPSRRSAGCWRRTTTGTAPERPQGRAAATISAPGCDRPGTSRPGRRDARPIWRWRLVMRSFRSPSGAWCSKGSRSTGSSCRGRGWS